MREKPGVEFIAPFRIYLPEEFFEVSLDGKISQIKPLALPPIPVEGTKVENKNIEILT
ncbi:MAG: hypothetical protein AB9891_01630 [Anaerolineaceae bacterium]